MNDNDWENGGAYQFPEKPNKVEVVSNNTDETIYTITGVNAQGEEITEEITLNGTTEVVIDFMPSEVKREVKPKNDKEVTD